LKDSQLQKACKLKIETLLGSHAAMNGSEETSHEPLQKKAKIDSSANLSTENFNNRKNLFLNNLFISLSGANPSSKESQNSESVEVLMNQLKNSSIYSTLLHKNQLSVTSLEAVSAKYLTVVYFLLSKLLIFYCRVTENPDSVPVSLLLTLNVLPVDNYDYEILSSFLEIYLVCSQANGAEPQSVISLTERQTRPKVIRDCLVWFLLANEFSSFIFLQFHDIFNDFPREFFENEMQNFYQNVETYLCSKLPVREFYDKQRLLLETHITRFFALLNEVYGMNYGILNAEKLSTITEFIVPENNSPVFPYSRYFSFILIEWFTYQLKGFIDENKNKNQSTNSINHVDTVDDFDAMTENSVHIFHRQTETSSDLQIGLMITAWVPFMKMILKTHKLVKDVFECLKVSYYEQYFLFNFINCFCRK
jgi:hypothetical protein